MGMPMGYDSVVGDMGSILSGGQLQRVLLARALYPRPKFLILDEGTANLDDATANLDDANEQKVLATLKSLPITRVAVAHRAATIKAADRVIFVANGEATEVRAKEP